MLFHSTCHLVSSQGTGADRRHNFGAGKMSKDRSLEWRLLTWLHWKIMYRKIHLVYERVKHGH